MYLHAYTLHITLHTHIMCTSPPTTTDHVLSPIIPCTHHSKHPASPPFTCTHHPSYPLCIPPLIHHLTYVVTTLHPAGFHVVLGANGGDLLQDVSPEELQSALKNVVSKTVSSFKNEISQKLRTSEQGHLNRLALVEKTVAS